MGHLKIFLYMNGCSRKQMTLNVLFYNEYKRRNTT